MYDIKIDFKCGRTQYRGPVKNEKGEIVTPGERVHPDDFTEDQRTRYVANGWMAVSGEEAKPLPVGQVAELAVENINSSTANKGI